MPAITTAQAKRFANALKETFLFSGFTAEEIAALLGMPGISYQRYAAGAEILSATSGGRGLGLLLKGSAVVEKHAQEGYLRMSVLNKNALFGMAAMFADAQTHEYPTRIVAQKDAAALFIPEAVFRDMLRADFRLTEKYIRYLTGRVHFLNTRIEELICPTVEQRVFLYLTQHAQEGRITLALTALAQSLNIGRASLYRALDKLEAAGRIQRSGRMIVIFGENARSIP